MAAALVDNGLTVLQHIASAGCHSSAPNDVYVQLLIDVSVGNGRAVDTMLRCPLPLHLSQCKLLSSVFTNEQAVIMD